MLCFFIPIKLGSTIGMVKIYVNRWALLIELPHRSYAKMAGSWLIRNNILRLPLGTMIITFISQVCIAFKQNCPNFRISARSLWSTAHSWFPFDRPVDPLLDKKSGTMLSLPRWCTMSKSYCCCSQVGRFAKRLFGSFKLNYTTIRENIMFGDHLTSLKCMQIMICLNTLFWLLLWKTYSSSILLYDYYFLCQNVT